MMMGRNDFGITSVSLVHVQVIVESSLRHLNFSLEGAGNRLILVEKGFFSIPIIFCRNSSDPKCAAKV